MSEFKVGFIIQARTGSTRLPQKMIREFHAGKTLMECFLDKFVNRKEKVVLATSESKGDDVLASIGKQYDIEVYRGSESNVLDRFLNAAQIHDFDLVVRLCGDNPFLNPQLIDILLEKYAGEDYFSFHDANETPTIRTHFGVFGELVKTSALSKVAERTSEKFYQEHVTNYIYDHKAEFDVKTIDLPEEVDWTSNIRLTVDTEMDFKQMKKLYAKHPNVENLEELNVLFEDVRSNQELLGLMQNEIIENSK